jgi:hypothetical protein
MLNALSDILRELGAELLEADGESRKTRVRWVAITGYNEMISYTLVFT